MEGRIWAIIGVLLLIACSAAGISYMTDRNSKEKELQDLKEELGRVEDQIKDEISDNLKSRESYENLKKIVDTHEASSAKKKQLEREITILEEEKKTLLKTFKDAVVQVRNASTGMAWPDFNHSNGQALRGVRIQRATDSEVTISHSEGVLKLTGDALTPELKARFRIGMTPLVESGK